MKQTSGYPRREDKRGYSSDICVHDLGGWTGQEWTLNQLGGKAAFTALRHLSSVHILLFCILLCWCYLWICDPWLPFLTDWTLVAFPSSVLAALYLFALHLFFTKASYAKLPGLHFYEVWTTTKKKTHMKCDFCKPDPNHIWRWFEMWYKIGFLQMAPRSGCSGCSHQITKHLFLSLTVWFMTMSNEAICIIESLSQFHSENPVDVSQLADQEKRSTWEHFGCTNGS